MIRKDIIHTVLTSGFLLAAVLGMSACKRGDTPVEGDKSYLVNPNDSTVSGSGANANANANVPSGDPCLAKGAVGVSMKLLGLTCEPAAPPPVAVCGNDKLDAGEECDDSNTVSGDGCSATCKKEATLTPDSGSSGGQTDKGETDKNKISILTLSDFGTILVQKPSETPLASPDPCNQPSLLKVENVIVTGRGSETVKPGSDGNFIVTSDKGNLFIGDNVDIQFNLKGGSGNVGPKVAQVKVEKYDAPMEGVCLLNENKSGVQQPPYWTTGAKQIHQHPVLCGHQRLEVILQDGCPKPNTVTVFVELTVDTPALEEEDLSKMTLAMAVNGSKSTDNFAVKDVVFTRYAGQNELKTSSVNIKFSPSGSYDLLGSGTLGILDEWSNIEEVSVEMVNLDALGGNSPLSYTITKFRLVGVFYYADLQATSANPANGSCEYFPDSKKKKGGCILTFKAGSNENFKWAKRPNPGKPASQL